MVAKVFKDIQAVVDQYSGLSRKVLDYSVTMGKIVEEGQSRDFSIKNLQALAEYVDVHKFQRVGNFLEEMSWQQYAEFLTRWAAGGAQWEGSFKRITEHDGVVFLELEERSRQGEHVSTINSNSVYEFNAAGKIVHLDIYLQMKPMHPDMMHAYDDVLPASNQP
jgi:hypothetical protein